MSQAFKEKWLRLSANRRLIRITNYLVKHANGGCITIPFDELEKISDDDGLVQDLGEASLVLRPATSNTQLFIIQHDNMVERKPVWQTTENEEPELPDRLQQVMGMQNRGVVSTLDDAEMARRERASQLTAVQREARERRGQPLPVTHPSHPPS